MIYNEKWERTKRYLFRNLLEDPGYRLSPVTEESLSDDLVSRPYSPLPDLVIEPEPNRHDDPPEFYQGLEVRMRRLYKRLMEDRESSEETEGLINIEKDISEYNVDQHNSHRELLESYRATPTESDPEIFNTNNVLKEVQNLSKDLDNKDKSAKAICTVIGFGRATIENRTTEIEFTESNFDNTHFISTVNDKSTGKSKLGNKCDYSENKNEQLELHFRSSPIISYGRTMLDTENKSNETELTELDMDLTNVKSTTENESKLIITPNISKSKESGDGQSKLEFEKQSTVDFGSKTFRVDGNKSTETELTESDKNDNHVILTTIAEIHEEPLSGKTAIIETEKENESPVLVPKLQKISSAGLLSGLTGNYILVDNSEDKKKSETMDDVEMTNETRKRDTIIDHSDFILDREVENIMQNDEVATLNPINEVNRASETSKESSEDNEELFAFLKGSNADTKAGSATETTAVSDKLSSPGKNRTQNEDEYVICNSFEMALRKEAFERINKRKSFDQRYEVESVSGEISDCKEVFIPHTTNDDENDIDSFEIAIRRENFQRINRRKCFGQSSEELQSADEDEEVEEMRGLARADPIQAFRRRSTASQESLLGTFAKPSAAEIHEDISVGDEGFHISCEGRKARDDRSLSGSSSEIKSPVLGSSSIQKYKVVKFHGGMSIDNEEHTNAFPGPSLSPSEIDNQEEFKAQKRGEITENKPTKSFPLEVRESSVGTEEATSPAPRDNVMSTLCDAIWSVSPIPINTADFSPVKPIKEFNKNVPTKRRQKCSSDVLEKRKKYQNKVVQTGSDPISWESIKSDFFVGTPRMFKLCSCNDHTCRK